jgi:hypothetical protein
VELIKSAKTAEYLIAQFYGSAIEYVRAEAQGFTDSSRHFIAGE